MKVMKNDKSILDRDDQNTDYGRPMKPSSNDIPSFLGYFRWNYQHCFGSVGLLSMGKWIWLFFLQ